MNFRAVTLLCLLASCSQAAPRAEARPAGERRVTLFVTSDLWGYLAPCGCSQNMRGGIDRAAAVIAEARKEGPTLLVDAGDALFDKTEYGKAEEVQAKLKAAALVDALAQMGLSAKVMRERDRTLPVEVPGKLVLDAPRVIEAGGVRVGLVPVEASAAGDLAAGVRSLESPDLVVALAHGPRKAVIALASRAKSAGVDVIAGSHIDQIAEGEEAQLAAAEVPVLFTQARGQSLLRLDVVVRGGRPFQLAGTEGDRQAELDGLDERILTLQERIVHLPAGTDASPFAAKVKELQDRRRALAQAKVAPPAQGSYVAPAFVPLTDDLPSDPAVKDRVVAYDREVAKANLAFAKASGETCPPPREGEAHFVGSATCNACHPAAYEHWKTTKHAAAWETLQEVGKEADLLCVSCHVTGWRQPGGACRVDQVEGREDVTCESCHGPGSEHLKKPAKGSIALQVPETRCRTCHAAEFSTAFEYPVYLDRILGPGHGQAPLGGAVQTGGGK